MRREREDNEDYFVCPHCGAEVRRDARACPECGSDDSTGWAEDADRWAAGIPAGYSGEDEFDYDEFVRREFGGMRRRVFGLPLWLAILLLALLGVVLLVGLLGL